MDNMTMGNASYNIQRVFVGKQALTEIILNKVFSENPQFLPLTNPPHIQYNNGGDSVVWRNNGI